MYQLHWAKGRSTTGWKPVLVLRLEREPKEHDYRPLCKNGCNCRLGTQAIWAIPKMKTGAPN
jgi:hypothetical protein